LQEPSGATYFSFVLVKKTVDRFAVAQKTADRFFSPLRPLLLSCLHNGGNYYIVSLTSSRGPFSSGWDGDWSAFDNSIAFDGSIVFDGSIAFARSIAFSHFSLFLRVVVLVFYQVYSATACSRSQ
jgi:hypothetical protein